MIRIYGTICMLFAVLFTARAERLVFVNGDALNGKVLEEKEGQIVFESDMCGTISIPTGKVAEVTVAAPLVEAEETELAKASEPEPESVPLVREKLNLPEQLSGSVNFMAWRRDRDRREEGLYNKINLGWDGEKHKFNWEALYSYKRDGDTKDDDLMRLSQIYRYPFTQRWFLQSLTAAEVDRVKNIDLKVTETVGLGVFLVKKPDLTLDVVPGLGYEYIEREDSSRQTLSPSFEENLNWKINHIFALNQKLSYIGDKSTYRVLFLSGLESKLTEALSVVLDYSWEYDNSVSDGTDKEDRKVQASVKYSF